MSNEDYNQRRAAEIQVHKDRQVSLSPKHILGGIFLERGILSDDTARQEYERSGNTHDGISVARKQTRAVWLSDVVSKTPEHALVSMATDRKETFNLAEYLATGVLPMALRGFNPPGFRILHGEGREKTQKELDAGNYQNDTLDLLKSGNFDQATLLRFLSLAANNYSSMGKFDWEQVSLNSFEMRQKQDAFGEPATETDAKKLLEKALDREEHVITPGMIEDFHESIPEDWENIGMIIHGGSRFDAALPAYQALTDNGYPVRHYRQHPWDPESGVIIWGDQSRKGEIRQLHEKLEHTPEWSILYLVSGNSVWPLESLVYGQPPRYKPGYPWQDVDFLRSVDLPESIVKGALKRTYQVIAEKSKHPNVSYGQPSEYYQEQADSLPVEPLNSDQIAELMNRAYARVIQSEK